MNVVILQGRPTRDPELKKGKVSGKVFCKMAIAVDREYRGKNTPMKTDYFEVMTFGKLGQACYNNIAKGALITVLGRIQNEEYIDNIGNKITKNTIIANRVTIHEWLRKKRPLEELESEFDSDLLIPREITNSLYKQIDMTDEDIPDDLAGSSVDENL